MSKKLYIFCNIFFLNEFYITKQTNKSKFTNKY